MWIPHRRKTQNLTSSSKWSIHQVWFGQSRNSICSLVKKKDYLNKRFTIIKGESETVAYIYAPVPVDEPVVQTRDNDTYLDKTFEVALNLS